MDTTNVKLEQSLKLLRCPHCLVHKPNLVALQFYNTTNDAGGNSRKWGIYRCSQCGGLVTASGNATTERVHQVFPSIEEIQDSIPEPAREYLKQAVETTFAPAGSLMLCASAVDAMLKFKNYKTGDLYTRIKKAIEDHVLTEEMGDWAHRVRLDANAQRHADPEAPLPNIEDAMHTIQFAKALAEFLFVIPSKIRQGIQSTEDTTIAEPGIGGAGSAL